MDDIQLLSETVVKIEETEDFVDGADALTFSHVKEEQEEEEIPHAVTITLHPMEEEENDENLYALEDPLQGLGQEEIHYMTSSGVKQKTELNKKKVFSHSEIRIKRRNKPICEVCNASFKQLGNLKVHMSCHAAERPYKCGVCQLSFRHGGHLAQHMRTHSEKQRSFVCTVCSASYKESDHLAQHLRTHTRNVTSLFYGYL